MSYNVIPVLYSTNHKGLSLLTYSIYSLIEHRNENTFYDIFILHNNLTKYDENKLLKKLKKLSQFNIHFINCSHLDNEFNLNEIHNRSKSSIKTLSWPAPMYYYFFAHLFIKDYQKIIYLDIDTLVLRDLLDLYKIETDKAFAGVVCATIADWITLQNYYKQTNNEQKLKMWTYNSAFISNDINEFKNYLNSGVLLINLNKLKTYNLKDIFTKAKEYNFADQDIVGYFFKDDIQLVDYHLNYCIHFFVDNAMDKNVKKLNGNYFDIENIKDVYIIHYSFRPKPNEFFNLELKDYINSFNSLDQYLDSFKDFNLKWFNINKPKFSHLQNQLLSLSTAYKKQIVLDFSKTNIAKKALIIFGKEWNKIC